VSWEEARPRADWFDPFFVPMAGPPFERLTRSLHGPMRLLHLGCGLGLKTETLRRLGYDVVGVDVDEALLRRAKEAFPRSAFVAADIQNLPFADASFDVVFSFSTLQLVDDKQRAIDESARVLRAGGRAIFIENLRGSPLARGYRKLNAALGFAYAPNETPRSHLDLAEVDRFERAFLDIETAVHHLTTPLTLVLPAVLARLRHAPMRVQSERLYNVLARLDRRIFRAFPDLRRFGWHVVATMTRRSGEP
jgi:SAM-dependent methyltransferase